MESGRPRYEREQKPLESRSQVQLWPRWQTTLALFLGPGGAQVLVYISKLPTKSHLSHLVISWKRYNIQDSAPAISENTVSCTARLLTLPPCLDQRPYRTAASPVKDPVEPLTRTIPREVGMLACRVHYMFAIMNQCSHMHASPIIRICKHGNDEVKVR